MATTQEAPIARYHQLFDDSGEFWIDVNPAGKKQPGELPEWTRLAFISVCIAHRTLISNFTER